jgi:predicted nucleic acid-binding protein
MTRRVLLDTNLLIAAFDATSTTSEEKRTHAKTILSHLLSDNEVALAITPLIRYEVLRGIAWLDPENYQDLKNILSAFTEFDISREVSELAADLYRFDKHQAEQKNENKNLEKRKFDIFHLACSKCNHLELASQDTDIAKLNLLYCEYTAACDEVKLEPTNLLPAVP